MSVLLLHTLPPNMRTTVRSGSCDYRLLWIHEADAESGAERSVMDDESCLEQIKGGEKLLDHQTCFWNIYGRSLSLLLRLPAPVWQSFSAKFQNESVDVNKIWAVITWAIGHKCQQKLSGVYYLVSRALLLWREARFFTSQGQLRL